MLVFLQLTFVAQKVVKYNIVACSCQSETFIIPKTYVAAAQKRIGRPIHVENVVVPSSS